MKRKGKEKAQCTYYYGLVDWFLKTKKDRLISLAMPPSFHWADWFVVVFATVKNSRAFVMQSSLENSVLDMFLKTIL